LRFGVAGLRERYGGYHSKVISVSDSADRKAVDNRSWALAKDFDGFACRRCQQPHPDLRYSDRGLR
jgi:hypothetical protein